MVVHRQLSASSLLVDTAANFLLHCLNRGLLCFASQLCERVPICNLCVPCTCCSRLPPLRVPENTPLPRAVMAGKEKFATRKYELKEFFNGELCFAGCRGRNTRIYLYRYLDVYITGLRPVKSIEFVNTVHLAWCLFPVTFRGATPYVYLSFCMYTSTNSLSPLHVFRCLNSFNLDVPCKAIVSCRTVKQYAATAQ